MLTGLYSQNIITVYNVIYKKQIFNFNFPLAPGDVCLVDQHEHNIEVHLQATDVK